MQGGAFAGKSYSREGEKANCFDYLVRWIHNWPPVSVLPETLLPPYEKKDYRTGGELRQEKALPMVDLQHSQCPNDGHELQVQNMTVMPSLRLAPEDAQDIASLPS